jgi:lipid-A-disaccharide synthase
MTGDSIQGAQPKSSRPIRLVILAGEPSGERHGAALFAALKELLGSQPIEVWGTGGEHMRAAGIEVVYDCGPFSSIGVANIVSLIPQLIAVRHDIVKRLRSSPPDLLVLIDAGAFLVPIAKWAKSVNLCPVFYYFPPGSWKRPREDGAGNAPRGSGQTDRKDTLASSADLIVTPFTWSEDALRRRGANVRFVGHPALDIVKPELSDEEFYDRFGLDVQSPLIALLPGSRHMEISYNLPTMLRTAAKIARRIPGVQFALGLAQSTNRDLVEQIIKAEQKRGGALEGLNLLMHQAGGKIVKIAQSGIPNPSPVLATNTGLKVAAEDAEDLLTLRKKTITAVNARDSNEPAIVPLVICDSLTYDVMARADLVITKSGTATLEAAILQKSMIIIYKGPWLMNVEWKLRKKKLNIPHVGMPNLMAGERVFPELLGDEATPEAISELAVDMLLQPERLMQVKDKMNSLVSQYLGEPGGTKRAAKLLADLLPGNRVKPDKQNEPN